MIGQQKIILTQDDFQMTQNWTTSIYTNKGHNASEVGVEFQGVFP